MGTTYKESVGRAIIPPTQQQRMANSSLLLAFYFFIMIVIFFPFTVDAISDHRMGWLPAMRPGCQGSIAECMGDGELEMDTEIHRRILATTQYISYKALQRNTVPCSLRGASYYNCKPGAEANPYSRGCSTITRCRNA